MSNKHTPGPWSAEPDFQGRYIVYGNDARVVGNVLPTSDGWRREDGEVTANARLIAAAPDLLAALSLTLEALESLRSDGVTSSEDDDAAHAAGLAIARAVDC